jgi:FkbM family methyltransferase
MTKFNTVEGAIRRNFYIYTFLRRIAPTVCKFIALEDGFDFLKRIKKTNEEFVAIDIGANDGTSIRMIKKYQSKVHIEAFDPITKPKFKLKNVNFHSVGLSNKVEKLEIYSPVVKGKVFSQYSSIYKEKLIHQITADMKLDKNQVSIHINHINLQILDDFNFKPFFVKIDVEGAELAVLEGAQATISKYLPVLLIEIQNQKMYQEIEEFLTEIDYFCVGPNVFKGKSKEISENSSKFRQYTNNYIWIPRGKNPSWTFKNKNFKE